MSAETSSATPPAKRRRWYQFSLRTLIVFTVVASVLLGLFAARLDRARRQAEAVATIRKHGGYIVYDYSFPDDNPRFTILQLQAKSNVPAWLLDLLGEDFFHDVVGVTARMSEGMTSTDVQEVLHAVETLEQNKLGWITVSE